MTNAPGQALSKRTTESLLRRQHKQRHPIVLLLPCRHQKERLMKSEMKQISYAYFVTHAASSLQVMIH